MAVRFVLGSMECAEEENALMFRDEHIHHLRPWRPDGETSLPPRPPLPVCRAARSSCTDRCATRRAGIYKLACEAQEFEDLIGCTDESSI